MKEAYQDYCSTDFGWSALSFEYWCQKRNVESPQFEFWIPLLDIELTVFMLIQSFREGDFNLYREALSELSPYLFANNVMNYIVCKTWFALKNNIQIWLRSFTRRTLLSTSRGKNSQVWLSMKPTYSRTLSSKEMEEPLDSLSHFAGVTEVSCLVAVYGTVSVVKDNKNNIIYPK